MEDLGLVVSLLTTAKLTRKRSGGLGVGVGGGGYDGDERGVWRWIKAVCCPCCPGMCPWGNRNIAIGEEEGGCGCGYGGEKARTRRDQPVPVPD